MTDDERESIIVQLALIQGVNKSVFEKLTNEQLTKELQKFYGEQDTTKKI